MDVVTGVINDVTAEEQKDAQRRVTPPILRVCVMVGVFLIGSAMSVISARAAFGDTTSNRVATGPPVT